MYCILLILTVLKLCLSDKNDKSLFPNLPVAPINSESELCKSESAMYLENLDNITLWSYQMWEASARSTTGSLQGSRYQMGDWDECMKVRAPFKTQFCLVAVKANINGLEPHKDPYALDRDPQGSVLYKLLRTPDISQMPRDTVSMGWCVPASCPLNDLRDVLTDHYNHSNTALVEHNVTYSVVIVEKLCSKQDEEVKPFDALDIIFCVILGIFLFLVIIGTFYEYKIEEKLTEKGKENYQKSKGSRILIGFSARKNFIDLARADDSNPALSSLYGLRTVSILFIILGHGSGTISGGPLLNYDESESGYRSIFYSFIFRADLFVDTFFVISGMLVAYGLLMQSKNKYVHPFYIIFWRYTRLTPVYMFVIFYYVTILNDVGSGPLWKSVSSSESNDCRNNWWTNMLYINNYVNANHICMTQSWYLACDFHYFIIATFIVSIFTKKKILGSALFIFCFILSITVPFALTVIYKEPALMLFYPDFLVNVKGHAYFSSRYITSHTRAGTYCIGMITGYIYYRLKGSEKQLSKLKSHIITFISIVLLLISMGSGGIFYNPYHKYNALEAGIYAALNRLTWAVGTMGLLLTASYGHTTVVQKVLSWSPFVPLSKLVYSVYLVHMLFQFRRLAVTMSAERTELFTMLSLTIGDCALSFIVGLVLYLLIETPTRKLFKELFTSTKPAVSPPEPITVLESANTNNHIQRESQSRL